MPEPASTGANRFFLKIYTSANAGLTDGRAPAGRMPFWASPTGQLIPEVASDAPFPFDGLINADGPVAREGDRDYYSRSTSPMANTSSRGEEGPLSGGRFGLNEKGIDFGESSISRSDAEAVGSVSKSSCDPHVGSIEHTEVGHTSGHNVSSSTDRIESGVLKKPESHQVLFSGNKVERYVDEKDRRQQAALSQDHGERGLGRQGLDNDRAGLPPPFFHPTGGPATARNGVSSQSGRSPVAGTQRPEKLPIDGPGPSPQRRSGDGDTGGNDPYESPLESNTSPMPHGAATSPRPTVLQVAPAPFPKTTPGKNPLPSHDASAGPVMPPAVASPVQTGPDLHVSIQPQEPRPKVPSGSHSMRDDKPVRPQYEAPEPLSNRPADPDTLRDTPLPAPPQAERSWTPPPDHRQRPDRVRPDVPPKQPAPADDPQVRIGHIDVILQTPQQGDAHKAAAASAGASGFASRYYLKGL